MKADISTLHKADILILQRHFMVALLLFLALAAQAPAAVFLFAFLLRNRYGEVGAGVGAEFFDAHPQIVGGLRQHKAELIQRAKGLLEALIEQ